MTEPKYAALSRYLAGCSKRRITLTHEQVAALVGGLPHSASTYSAWWANEGAGSRHVQARSWLGVGYVVGEVRLGRSVTFLRKTR